MKSFIASLLLGPVVATNGAVTLRRLQFPSFGAAGGGNLMSGIIKDIGSPDSGAASAQSRHCKDALASSCDRTGASGSRDNFKYNYDAEGVAAQRGEFAQAMQARMGREGGAEAGAPAMPALFANAGASPPQLGSGLSEGPPSPPWAQAATGGEEAKLTVRQKFQVQFGMEVTPDPYGIPAPESPATPESPFGAAPESPFGAAPESPFGAAPESPFGAAPESPFGGGSSPFEGLAAGFAGGASAGPPANVGSLLRGGVSAQAATPQSQVQQTGNLTEQQRQRAAAVVAASTSASTSNSQSGSTRPSILPPASPFK